MSNVSCFVRNTYKGFLKKYLFLVLLPHFLFAKTDSVLQLATNINSCVVTGSKVYCWGSEAFHGARNIPSPPRDIEGVLFVKLSEYYGCAETKKGLKCWGDSLFSPTQAPADLGGILQLSLSTYHACAITLDKKVKCWGSNRDRRLDVPLDLGVASQVVATESCTCAVTQDGVRCWGGINPNSCVPKDIGPIVQLAFSDDGYRCAITAVGGVRCWGGSEHWMEQREGTRIEGTAVRREITYLERITLMRRDPPRDLGFAKQLSVGRSHSCVLSEKGVQCWRNKMPIDYYADYRFPDDHLFVLPNDLTEVSQISVGQSHICTLGSKGVRCWGHNEEGQLEVPAEISQLDYRFVKSDFIYQDKASMEADQFHDLESRINKSKNPLEALNLIYKNIWQIPILDSLNLRSKLCSDYRNELEVISLNPYEKSNLLKDLKVHFDSWLLCKEYFSVKLNPEVRKLASLFLGQLSPSDYIAVTSYLNKILFYRNQYKFDDKLSIKAKHNLEFSIEKSKIDNDQSRHLKMYRDLHFPMDAESQRIFVFVRYLYFLIEAKQEMGNARTPN